MGSSRPEVGAASTMKKITLTQGGKEKYRRAGEKKLRERMNAMTPENREGFAQLQEMAADDDFDADDLPAAPNVVNLGDILDGSARIDISHAGGEFDTLEREIEEDSGEDDAEEKKQRAEDWRTRRDRTETRNRQFLSQMPEMVKAYLRLCAEPEMPARPGAERNARAPTVDEVWELDVVDMFNTTNIEVKLNPRGDGVVPALIMEGMMPCAPYEPNVAIKIRVLEAYRVMHCAYKPYLCQQFSIAYDVYLDIRRRVDGRVMKVLGRDSSWRLKHACPACMYKLEGEDKLIFDILTTMDGNDSLKRVLRREKCSMEGCETGEPTLGQSKERVDNCDAGDGYYLSREKVERWAKTRLAAMLPMQAGNSAEDNPCADRWKNMVNDVTSKMWGIFDETGIFLALCRHGFVLVLADMIRSGELAKYPLAVVKELLDVFGLDIGAGYDVGCHFGATVANSDLGDLAREKNLRCLVGSFHGHAHNRLCQLSFLATYVEGMGLEDLEGCERYFSRSNGLAKSCRYANRFHRQQEITTYAKHFDSFETYANLSKFLCTNYRQALNILKTEATLKTWMTQEGMTSYNEFRGWLNEERDYLLSLKDAPKKDEETLEMVYVQKLVNLSASQAKYSLVAAEAKKARGDDATYTPGASKEELARRRAKEKVERDQDTVEELEEILKITARWTTTSPKWLSTVVEVKKRRYQTALDALELLIVERIFELTKMNQSQTGYKMRKHIAKALQSRSKAVRNAIDRYNTAATLLDPPMPQLSWEQVVEYAFLADFDILRDTRAEVRSRPWTRPAYRLAMDRFFKILRAKEEIKRLNMEIPRVITWIRDENRTLRRREAELREEEGKSADQVEADIEMAVQVCLYRQRRGRFEDGHMRRFWALARTPGFTGSVMPGISVERREAQQTAAREAARVRLTEDEMDVDEDDVVVVDGASDAWQRAEEDEWEYVDQEVPERGDEAAEEEREGEGHDAKEEEISGLVYCISLLAVDGGNAGSGDEG
ncbi:hypothetical protein C8R43DRAFT_954234 [Mycena crocata]|nr:hypothetical protein C8R43DRAFT_954234 [Mycena crocata]